MPHQSLQYQVIAYVASVLCHLVLIQRTLQSSLSYLPCSDMDMECYSEHLIELEQVVSEHQPHGPVIVMGDFNAHLGTQGGERGMGQPNQQGILLYQLITRCSLYAVSQASLSQGPFYTFQNSVSQTTVDNI